MATIREQFLRVMRDGDLSEGFPVTEFAPYWDLTQRRWESEGLPKGLTYLQALDYFGVAYRPFVWKPAFTAKTRELANLPEDWRLELPMIRPTEKDYARVLPGLFPSELHPTEIQAMEAEAERQAKGDVWILLYIDGPFWFPRMLLGVEPHLMAFCEQPALMKRMTDDLTEYNLSILEKICEIYTPDTVVFAEDLAYRHGSMISRDMFDEFLAPHYKHIVPFLVSRGILPMVDSDGFIEPLIPWFESAGIAGLGPMERQAGVDVVRIRREHPKFAMYGGFDKTVMHLGEAALRAEFDRLRPAVRAGRYIPMTDHQVPPSVSLEDYRLYIRLLREFSDEMAREAREAR